MVVVTRPQNNHRQDEEARKLFDSLNFKVRDFSKAVSLKKDLEDAYLNRGNTFMKIGRFEEATKDYDVAISYYPDFAMAFYNRGIANHNLGNNTQACDDIKKSLELGFKQAEDTLMKMCK